MLTGRLNGTEPSLISLAPSVFFLLWQVKMPAVKRGLLQSGLEGMRITSKWIRRRKSEILIHWVWMERLRPWMDLWWDDVVSNVRINICEEILEEVQIVPPEQRKNEWKWLLRVKRFTWIFKENSQDFKSQSLPWMKWCPANYQVQKGNHLLCCPLPTMLDGLVPPLQEEVWFSQSRSSRPWPVPYCRERITRSCQSPAETKTDNGRNKNTGKNDWNCLFF